MTTQPAELDVPAPQAAALNLLIRDAKPQDVAAITDLVERVLASAAVVSRLTYSRARLAATAKAQIKARCVWLVAAQGAAVVGVAFGVVADHWGAAERVGVCGGLFVDPTMDAARVAGQLIDAFSTAAAARGARIVQFASTAGIPAEAGGQLFESAGLTPVGHLFEVAAPAAMSVNTSVRH